MDPVNDENQEKDTGLRPVASFLLATTAVVAFWVAALTLLELLNA
jgi:hypothetical protein